MRKSLGEKRREIAEGQIGQIVALYTRFVEDENSKIFDAADFGYRKITVERPLRLNFQATPERIKRIKNEPGFIGLVASKKKDPVERAAEEAAGRPTQELLLDILREL